MEIPAFGWVIIWFFLFWALFILFDRLVFKRFWQKYEMRVNMLIENPKLAERINAETAELSRQYQDKISSAKSSANMIIKGYVDEARARREEELAAIEREVKAAIAKSHEDFKASLEAHKSEIDELASKTAEKFIRKALHAD